MNCSSVMLAAASVAIISGCAIRYDHAGVTRVGVGLWGLGDPPGVNWNLDWPRNEVPELPPMRKPETAELPPMRPRELPGSPRSLSAPVDDASHAPKHDGAAERVVTIDDNSRVTK